MLLPFPASAQIDTIHSWLCLHSTDSGSWRTLTAPTTVPLSSENTAFDIGFDYAFEGSTYTALSVAANGSFNFSNAMLLSRYGSEVTGFVGPFVCLHLRLGSGSRLLNIARLRTQCFGTPGSRTLVAECAVPLSAADTLRYQLHLSERDGAIRVVLQPLPQGCACQGSLSICMDGQFQYLAVRLENGQPSDAAAFSSLDSRWHDCRFAPLAPVCPTIRQLHAEEVSHTSARIRWTANAMHSDYRLEYGSVGFATGEGTAVFVTNPDFRLGGLQPGTLYEARVTASCVTGAAGQSASCIFRTYCDQPHGNQIPFANLYDSNVVCRIGTFGSPDQQPLVADFGPASILSRHTVHYDMLETDPRTGNELLTVPDGHCMSVRLGNHNCGAQEESVTYRLHVDTTDYDLLILRYAVVEEDPDHPLEMQPKFIFSVDDSVGNPIGDCYTANFVSGSATGWHTCYPQPGQTVLWRDWHAVGVDLGPLHGRQIQVRLANYDCNAGGHYGYAYFTLESARKTFETEYCGNVPSNTFYAPSGFSYRWYALSAPDSAIALTDTLRVSGAGRYGCWVGYNLSGTNCGFAMSTTAGSRTPAASFQMTQADSCGSTFQFANHSCVVVNGSPTAEPCPQYLWRFGDGTTSQAVNPRHTFVSGTYTVELVAMLSNGACRDSVRQTLHVALPADTQHVTLCPGTRYPFFDRFVTDSGTYTYHADCQAHVLEVSLYPVAEQYRSDTICERDRLVIGDTAFFAPGRHRYAVPDQHGCDSVQWIDLTVLPLARSEVADTLPLGEGYIVNATRYAVPGIHEVALRGANGCDSLVVLRLSCLDQRDSLVCVSALPVVWDSILFAAAGADTLSLRSAVGTDSLVVRRLEVRYPPEVEPQLSRTCRPQAFYTVRLPAGYRYTWQSDPVDSDLQRQQPDTLVRLAPVSPTEYYVTADYPDAPSCPAFDTLRLEVAYPLTADLFVSPAWLSADNLDFLAADQSRRSVSRQWYVDGRLQWEEGRELRRTADAHADSVVVMLRIDNGSCEDSATQVLPIYHYTIAFPNIFTPGATINNSFGCTATHIADYQLWIYDRRGALVFHTDDLRQTWDGTCHGVVCPQAAYVYHCEYSIPVAGLQSQTGTVLLLR